MDFQWMSLGFEYGDSGSVYQPGDMLSPVALSQSPDIVIVNRYTKRVIGRVSG